MFSCLWLSLSRVHKRISQEFSLVVLQCYSTYRLSSEVQLQTFKTVWSNFRSISDVDVRTFGRHQSHGSRHSTQAPTQRAVTVHFTRTKQARTITTENSKWFLTEGKPRYCWEMCMVFIISKCVMMGQCNKISRWNPIVALISALYIQWFSSGLVHV